MTDIAHFIQPKTVPVRSISLTKVDEHMPTHSMICGCDMCRYYESKRISEILQSRTKQINEKIAAKAKNKYKQCTPYYMWIIKHLAIPANKIITKGLDICLPQIIFYKEGEANKLFCMKEIDDPIIKKMHKQKLSNNFILNLFSERRRKYREKINNFLGRKKECIVKKPLFGSNKQVKRQIKDGVIIKYTDGLQNIITQNEFASLMQRRKLDSVWRQIFYIKNCIPADTHQCKIIFAKFIHNDIKYEELYKRAATLMQVYGQNILPIENTYITEEEENTFCKSLQKQSMDIFGEYLSYKMAHFVEYFYDEKINMMVTKFLINEMGQAYLDDVIKLETKPLIKYQWTQDAYLRKIEEEQQRVFFSKEVQSNEQVQKNAKEIENQMNDTFQKLKQRYGLNMQEEDKTQEIANNEFFQTLHPHLKKPISEILHDKILTVQKFKRDYLGYKPTKKPIVRPFTSNMIHTLHKMTPRFSRAQTHEYIVTPKRSSSSSFSRSSKRRSLSYTKSFTSTVNTPRK